LNRFSLISALKIKNLIRPIFKRILLLIIGKNWDIYTEKFWYLLGKYYKQLFSIKYRYELLECIRINLNKINIDGKAIIKTYIEEGPYIEIDDIKEKYLWRQQCFSVLKSDTYFNKQYEKYQEGTDREVKFHPPYHVEILAGPGPSPLSKDEMLNLNNEELVKETEKTITERGWNAPTKEALANNFRIIAKENPDKFLNDYIPLLKLTTPYISEIISGFKDAWKSKNSIDWDKLFDFFNAYIVQDKFIENIPVTLDFHYETDSNWVVKEIASLIKVGTIDENYAFDIRYINSKRIYF